MKILEIRPEPNGSGGSVVASFDIELSDHLRLFHMILRRTPDGRMRSFAPNAFGKHAATFHPALAEQITEAAVAALMGSSKANANRNAA